MRSTNFQLIHKILLRLTSKTNLISILLATFFNGRDFIPGEWVSHLSFLPLGRPLLHWNAATCTRHCCAYLLYAMHARDLVELYHTLQTGGRTHLELWISLIIAVIMWCIKLQYTYLGLHKFSSYLSSRWFEYKFLKLWDITPVEGITEVKCLWILAFKPFAKFTRTCLICRDAFLHLFDPFSKNSPQTDHSLFLKCPYFLRCDKMPWTSTRWLEKWRFGGNG